MEEYRSRGGLDERNNYVERKKKHEICFSILVYQYTLFKSY